MLTPLNAPPPVPTENQAVVSDLVTQALLSVLQDSQQEPAKYLDETVVPYGGE